MQAVDNTILMGERNRQAPWYTPTMEKEISPETRDLLENYAHVAPEDIQEHIMTMVSTFPPSHTQTHLI